MKSLFILVFVAFSMTCSVFAQVNATEISVTIDGLPAGTTKIVGTLGDQNFISDTAVIDAKGHFTISRKDAMTPGWYMALLPNNLSFQFLVDQNPKFKITGNVADLIGSLRCEGSVDNELMFDNARYQSKQETLFKTLGEQLKTLPPSSPQFAEVKKQQDALMTDRKTKLEEWKTKYPNTFFTKFKIAGQNPEIKDFKKPNGDTDTLRQIGQYRKDLWENVDFADERLLHTPVVANKMRRYLKELSAQNPDSLIISSEWLLQKSLPYKEYFKFFVNNIALTFQNGKTNIMDGEAVMVYVIQKYFKPEYAFWSTPEELQKIQKQAWEMEASLLGRKGPNVSALDVNGQMKSIYDITAPIIVIFMYSPDCEHCREQSPTIKQLSEKWKNKGVEFYGIGVNTTQEEWTAYVKKAGFAFTNVFDPTNRAIYAKYYVDNTPELYVLDKNRNIIAKNLNANQLEIIFEREFKKM